MTQGLPGWMPPLFGPVVLQGDGVEATPRITINFVGFTPVDRPELDRLDLVPVPASSEGVVVAMRTSAVDTTLVSADDYHLTMTAAKIATLPLAPAAGESFEVKAKAAGVSVAPGAGATIEGGASYAMVNGECVTVRFNSSSNDWETC